MLRALRFLRGYLQHPVDGVSEREETIDDGGVGIPATVYRPHSGAHRAWILLHGITVTGRAHPTLQRFARSLAGAGAVVILPEIEAWRKLHVDPTAAERVITAAVTHVSDTEGVLAGGAGLMGFSFGATQALVTASKPDVRRHLRAVVAYGGYCDPHAAFLYSFTGEHEWRGIHARDEPDPYARWVVSANYLTDVPGMEGMHAVARELYAIAAEAGRIGVFSGDATYDGLKAHARASLSPAERELWDLIAPTSDRLPPRDEARELGERIIAAALIKHPMLDPRPVLGSLSIPIILAHGYHDQLIPHTETLKLNELLPAPTRAHLSISRLYAHSQGAPLALWAIPIELVRYARFVDRMLSLG